MKKEQEIFSKRFTRAIELFEDEIGLNDCERNTAMFIRPTKPETMPRYGTPKGFRIRNKATGKKHKHVFKQLSDAELYLYRMGDENSERFEIIPA